MSGSIRKRGEDYWEIRYDVGRDAATGKRRTRYANFRGGKRDAEIELSKLIAQNAAGGGVDPSTATVAVFFERWHSDWASVNVSPKTSERYGQIIASYVVPHVGNVKIQKLRAAHLSELYGKLSREGGRNGGPLSANTVGDVHRLMRRVLGHAATWGVVQTNVATLVKPPRVPATEIKILSEDQISTVLNSLNGKTLRPIVSFLLGTGCRRNEALALMWKDVELDAGRVRIERALEQTSGGVRIKEPKTRHSRRNVAISPWLVAELRALRARQQETRLRVGTGRVPDDGPVFAKWNGEAYTPHWLTQKFALVMAGLKIPCTLHSLRHLHVSKLISAGMDVLTISRRIGHANPAITLRVYGHMFANTDERAAEIMQAAFSKVDTNTK
jgi:integrase